MNRFKSGTPARSLKSAFVCDSDYFRVIRGYLRNDDIGHL